MYILGNCWLKSLHICADHPNSLELIILQWLTGWGNKKLIMSIFVGSAQNSGHMKYVNVLD